VADTGTAVTQTTLQDKWNGSRSALESGLIRLQNKNILRREEDETGGEPVYRMVHEKKWR
jgi:predicted transcriptional regulator